jgi:hypothetical protein
MTKYWDGEKWVRPGIDDETKLREQLWAGSVITRKNIEDGLIPVEHLQGSPEWSYCHHTGNWYNDKKCVDLVQQKAEQHRAAMTPGHTDLMISPEAIDAALSSDSTENLRTRLEAKTQEMVEGLRHIKGHYSIGEESGEIIKQWRYINRIVSAEEAKQFQVAEDDGLPLFNSEYPVVMGIDTGGIDPAATFMAEWDPETGEVTEVEIEVHDSHDLMGDLLSTHMAQLRAWGKDAEADLIGKNLEDIGIIVAEVKWEPPVSQRDSGFICTNCGQDRGIGAVCESCDEYTATVHIVAGRVVE